MVQGKLQCLGTSHHLKTRFGKGYEIQLRCTGRFPSQPTPVPVTAPAPALFASQSLLSTDETQRRDVDNAHIVPSTNTNNSINPATAATAGAAVSDNMNYTSSSMLPVIAAVYETFKTSFPSAIVRESHGLFASLRCDDGIVLDRAFSWLEDNKREGIIFDYSLSETSLEQIFVEFAQMKGDIMAQRGDGGVGLI